MAALLCGESNNMNILFLDDNEQRQSLMRSRLPFIRQAFNAKEAIDILQQEDIWDYVFLDHDLGGEIFVDSDNENTGAAVARWIASNKPKTKKIIVHSYNSIGAKAIRDILIFAGYEMFYVPFLTMGFILIVEEISNE